jgi:hypothetical protein
MTPRGIRNNNPGNIRWGDDWRGLVPADQRTDPDFCQFIAPVYGVRAIGKILLSYRRRGLNTVRSIIATWAPPIENDTGAYAAHVAEQCGVTPDEYLPASANGYAALVKAIIQHENGQQPYSDNTIADALKLAGIG